MKKLKIDEQFCIGCNVCVDLCPTLFTSTDLVPEVADLDVSTDECAEASVDICPVSVIKIVEV